MLVKPRNNFPMNQYKKTDNLQNLVHTVHVNGSAVLEMVSTPFFPSYSIYIVILLISNDFFQISIHILQYILTL